MQCARAVRFTLGLHSRSRWASVASCGTGTPAPTTTSSTEERDKRKVIGSVGEIFRFLKKLFKLVYAFTLAHTNSRNWLVYTSADDVPKIVTSGVNIKRGIFEKKKVITGTWFKCV